MFYCNFFEFQLRELTETLTDFQQTRKISGQDMKLNIWTVFARSLQKKSFSFTEECVLNV